MPDWNNDGTNPDRTTGTGGYGIFQHTYEESDANYIMPRNYIWNWQANVDNYASKFNEKYDYSVKTYNGLRAKYSHYSDIPNRLSFSGLESLVITYINGANGRTVFVKLPGLSSPRKSCWDILNGAWNFFPNGSRPNGYVDKIADELNN